jgi:hypothetical protein
MRLVHQYDISELRAALSGRVITPDDAGYDAARTVFYGGIDRRPALIARVANAADVARVVAFARASGLTLAVRSGGHSVAGHSVSDGGIVLDLADMKALAIDPERRTAWAETGLTASEYTTATGAYGLATGFGDTGSVGIGGITLGRRRGFAPPTQGRPGTACGRSRRATTQPTSSASTRTSRRRPRIHGSEELIGAGPEGRRARHHQAGVVRT